MSKQTEATSYVQELLQQRRLGIPSKKLTLPDNQQWAVFEHNGRQLGIDSVSGVWVRESDTEDWRCVCMPCNVSGAIQAVGFLMTK